MANDPATAIYNRVLLKRAGFYRLFASPDGRQALRYDPASLSHLVEEFVACSAIDIALTPNSPARFFLQELSPILGDRVTILDPNGEVERETRAFLKPLADEFGLEFRDRGMIVVPREIPKGLSQALRSLLPGLYDFLLAARHHLQVDLNLAELRAAAESARRIATNVDARAHLAALVGVLNTYSPVQVPSLALVSAATDEQEARFKDLVEDLAYRELSEDAALLGIPDDAKRAARLMARVLRRLLKKPWIAASAKAGAKMILASKGVQTPELDVAKLVTQSGYFPPVISFENAYVRAESTWSADRRPATEVDLYQKLIADGFVEQTGFPQPRMGDFQGMPPGAYVAGPDEDR